MHLDPATCERARQARDPRFDGRFFIGVQTTGVYCRPVCRVRMPLARNVAFYPTAAAAEEAGFRPCRRCRPETAPGTPAWLGTSATVARGLRLIESGALDKAGVPALATQLGVGDRQLRRLFVEHVGATPLAVARTRRTHFARRLIDETQLPMSEIALTAGFGSVRQFNDALRQTFQQTPSELRAGARLPSDGDCILLRLPFREPFDWKGLLTFLAPRAMPGVERVGGAGYHRAIGPRTWIDVTRAGEAAELHLRVHGELPATLIDVAARARHLFDLGADPDRIVHDLGGDAALRPLIRRHPGRRLPGAWDPFETSVRAVLGQQVSVPGATTLAGRLVESFGKPLGRRCIAGLTHLFPSAERLADADVASIGLPRKRADAIRTFSRAVAEGTLKLDGAGPLDESLHALRALPGFGDWTAQYLAMRALGEPDAFPAGDLGLRRALGSKRSPATERAARDRAEAWRPWRSYAAVWLWSSLVPDLPRARRKQR